MEKPDLIVQKCGVKALDDWARLRHALWPETGEPEHRAEAESILKEADRSVAFLVRDADGTALGFAEATLRHDYVNGCTTSPVAFLEGIYVLPECRRRGVGRLLVRAFEQWAAALGCAEVASDADLRNAASQELHAALGFEETERVVFYRKALPAHTQAFAARASTPGA
jgi:aminoglycoside 6'-N-acetyltransferase I